MKSEQYESYKNDFAPTNVYGHALALLKKHQPLREQPGEPYLHVDIGCGYGSIADHVERELGLRYVGLDLATEGIQSLARRGYETHQLDLSRPDLTDALRAFVAGRRVGSISMLDTLEHLYDGDAVLRSIRDLAAEHRCIAVISVPNVAHRDVGARLALGRWEYTTAGILDHTHTRMFSGEFLEKVLRHCGLFPVDSLHVRMEASDQAFPRSHPALSGNTTLGQLLQRLRNGVDGYANVNQFVHACIAGPSLAESPIVSEREVARPFLSVVTRTQGKRTVCLSELAQALAAQDCGDFEWLIVGHDLSIPRQIDVERVIEGLPEGLKGRTRLIRVERGNRTRPLNEGFQQASGEYISIMDDDDLPYPNWVETFRSLAQQYAGRLLRAGMVKQDVTMAGEAVVSVGPPANCYPDTFNFLDHLAVNRTPNMALAFPRGAFHDLNMRFDESLTTTEDWDYLMRVASVAGVASSTTVTSVYRWWISDHSSRRDHQEIEWNQNYQRVCQKMDQEIVLFPPFTAGQIRGLINGKDSLQETCDHLRAELAAARDHDGERGRLLREVAALMSSRSWRASAILRLPGRLVGRRPVSLERCLDMNAHELRSVISAIRASTSWRATGPLRRRPSRAA